MRLFLVFGFFISMVTAFAQPTFENRLIPPVQSQWYSEVIPEQDGGLTYVNNSYYPIPDFLICRKDVCHQQLWARKLPLAAGWYYGRSASIKTLDGGYIIGGSFQPTGSYRIPAIMKLDSNGRLKWTKILPVNRIDGRVLSGSVLSCTIDNSGNIVVYGTVADTVKSQWPQHFLIKMDNSGKIKWSKKFITDEFDYYSVNLFAVPDGYVVVKNKNFQGSTERAIIIKLDTGGNFVWGRRLMDPFSSGIDYTYLWLNSITADKAGNLYLGGSLNTYPSQAFLIILNSTGWLTKAFTYPSLKGNLLLNSLLCRGDSGLWFCFYEYNNGTPNAKTYLCRADLSGKIISSTYWGKSNYYNWGDNSGLKLAPDSSFLLSSGSTAGYYQYDNRFIKTTRNGKGLCSTDTSAFGRYPLNLPSKTALVTILPGFPVEDTVVNLSNVKIREKIFCSSRYYPIADLGPDTILCSDTSYTLYSGDYDVRGKITWSNRTSDSVLTVTKSGRYWVRITSGTCTSSDTVNVVFRHEIQAALPTEIRICRYDSALLQSPVKDIPIYWVVPGNRRVDKPMVYARDTGVYCLYINGTGDCALLDTIHLTYYPMPAAVAGPDTLLCYNQEYTMQGAGGARYHWIPASFLSSDTIAQPQAVIPHTQPYVLVVTNKEGCRDTAHVLIKVRDPLKVKVSATKSKICPGASVKLNTSSSGGYFPGYTINWSQTGSTGDSVTVKPSASAWYKATLTDNCSPPVADSVYIEVVPSPVANFNIIPADSVTAGTLVRFDNVSRSAVRYLWNFGNSNASNETSPTWVYTDTGKYRVSLIAWNAAGCMDSIRRYIYIEDKFRVFIPDAFTPNGDQLNDTFEVKATGLKSCMLTIYNQWGELVFSGNSTHPGWDGRLRSGAESPSGVYLYSLTLTDLTGKKHYLSGNVTLLR